LFKKSLRRLSIARKLNKFSPAGKLSILKEELNSFYLELKHIIYDAVKNQLNFCNIFNRNQLIAILYRL